ncbi:16S rRNA (cytosine967-C5)-methyltransferase [Abditibacterium utsteinense]|uniref:16S rRNA (cytosine(967)-C(5))-methyltransferase n=1 Tax=Abditibacterium utsteinense TaxID=1960156 RepID=A0A2S8SPZ3_9BACT|nr:16S rRNA (cytosine(967)-C(5))-methyltransferase RsmB [Abditibacterium utsteinense]PQV62854.1 16S rRNA (cytosine967-C5)-methyltransferase [Abditibacterium utsteinense]
MIETHPKTLARRAALRALVRSEREDFSPPDFAGVDVSTRPFAREIYSNTLRHRARIDWSLAPLLKKPIDKLDDAVRAALRLALYEKVALRTPDRALANEYAGLMRGEKLGSATGFINAIARRLPECWREASGDEAQRLSIEKSHPKWLVERYIARFGTEETEKLLRANNQVAPLCLRANTLKVSRDELVSQLENARAGALSPDALFMEGGATKNEAISTKNEGAENVSPIDSSPTSSLHWQRGEVFAQDEAAQLVSFLGAPKAGDFVIDCASAPGGKTTHLAQMMNNQGRILALDSAPPRLQMVRDNAERLGISIIETRAGDLRVVARELAAWSAHADLVCLDAPCLGTGTLRRRPDAKWRKTPAQLEQLVELQSELLDAAALLVRPGGALLYSTCSLEPEENQGQIEAFLDRIPGFEIVAAPDFLRNAATPEGFLNTFPHRNGCDGMFAAKLRRVQ